MNFEPKKEGEEKELYKKDHDIRPQNSLLETGTNFCLFLKYTSIKHWWNYPSLLSMIYIVSHVF